jgi:predicted alpha/beta superfamily hydrolase
MLSRHPRVDRFVRAVLIGAVAIAAASAPALARSEPSRPEAVVATRATQPVPALLPLAVQFDVTSVSTGRTYRIYVSKPVAPAPAGGYGILYVLDGDSAFPTAASQAVLASMLEGSKPIVVVGIGYPDVMASLQLRTRDLTPYSPDMETVGPTPAEPGEWGGADAFHKFMLEELRPIIAGMTIVDKGDQALMGYSLGGLFALHVLLSNPGAYQKYVIGSPAIHWNKPKVLENIPAFAEKVRGGKVAPQILITSAELEQSRSPRSLQAKFRMVDNARELADTLRRIKGRNGYRVEYALFLNETHNSGIPASTSRGVAFVEGVTEGVTEGAR